MTDAKSPPEVADQAAEAIRELNHQLRQGALQYAADVYEVVGSLKTASGRLPQLFGAMATWLEREQAAGRLGHVSGQDAGEYALAAADALRRAGDDAMLMTEAPENAHSAASGLKHDD
jgi:uncharacterized protein YbjT (DUF2867 family)